MCLRFQFFKIRYSDCLVSFIRFSPILTHERASYSSFPYFHMFIILLFFISRTIPLFVNSPSIKAGSLLVSPARQLIQLILRRVLDPVSWDAEAPSLILIINLLLRVQKLTLQFIGRVLRWDRRRVFFRSTP